MPAPLPIRQEPEPDVSLERHYSVAEIAELWGLSAQKVHDVFAREAGVVRLGSSTSSGRKRKYVVLRIPQSVVQRVHALLTR